MLNHLLQYFVGIDLAWSSHNKLSGVAIISGNADSATLASCCGFMTVAEIAEYVSSQTGANTVVAIDAPLIITNESGQRGVETQMGKRFGKYDASAHSVNSTLYPNASSLRLVKMLSEKAFEHSPNPPTDKLRKGRWIFEVCPHPAQIVLFQLPQILKYKRGRINSRKVGLYAYRGHFFQLLTTKIPTVQITSALMAFLSEGLCTMKGTALKFYEDKMDALFCAYLAYYYWYWGGAKCEMIGEVDSGYIINPR